MIKIKLRLQLIVILIANLLLSIGNCSDLKNENILIIGAGSSGIAAATKLIENGFTNMKILEAENRIGGRVYTRKFGVNDTNIDMGAQWCHGEKGNVVYELAAKYDLFKDMDFFTETYYVQSNGVEIPSDIGDSNMKILYNITSNTEISEYDGTIGNFIIERYKPIAKELNYNETLTNNLLKYFELLLCSNIAFENWHQQTGTGYGIVEECEGSQVISWTGHGFKTILDILMKKYPDPSKDLHLDNNILLNKNVNKIIIENDYVSVKTSDGEEYKADKVIVTVSLGVLKERYAEMFVPKLPLKKQTAIENLSIGTVDKIFFEFETQWWPNNWAGINTIWNTEYTDNNSTNWLSRLIGIYSDEYQPNILCGWISESNDKYFEHINDDTVKEDAINYLEKITTNKYKISKLINLVRTNWYSNPNFRGAWSYNGIIEQQFNVTNSDLAESITNENGKNIILFAGEATHSTHHSSVHGAIESGWRAAQEIIDEINENNK